MSLKNYTQSPKKLLADELQSVAARLCKRAAGVLRLHYLDRDAD